MAVYSADVERMIAGINRAADAKAKREPDFIPTLAARVALLVDSFKSDVADWSPTIVVEHPSRDLIVLQVARTVHDLADLLDTLGEIVTELDYGTGITTTREDEIREETDTAAFVRGVGEGRAEEAEAWADAVRAYFEHVGTEAEYDGKPYTIADRWTATDAERELIRTAHEMGAADH